MASHRSRITSRLDFTKYWSLKLWRNPNKKFQVIKCEVCHPRKRINTKKVGKILELDNEEPLEDIEPFNGPEVIEYYFSRYF